MARSVRCTSVHFFSLYNVGFSIPGCFHSPLMSSNSWFYLEERSDTSLSGIVKCKKPLPANNFNDCIVFPYMVIHTLFTLSSRVGIKTV